MKKNFIVPFVVCLFILLGSPLWGNEERIDLFDVTATIQADGLVKVRERIHVTALGDEIKRGIIRVFPTDYEGSSGMVRTGFELLSTTLDGESVESQLERVEGNLEIRLGSADVVLKPGQYVYEILYRTKGWIAFRQDFDEFYWNVTGNDWIYPIDRAVYKVILPEGGTILKSVGFTGGRGSTAEEFTALSENTFETTGRLAPGEGFTVSVAWKKGLVSPPLLTPTEQRRQWLVANRHLIVFFLAGVFLLYYGTVWFFKGKDPSKGTVIPLFEPPSGVEPGYVRFFRDREYSSESLAADILQLAVKGALRFEERSGAMVIVPTDAPRDEMDLTPPLRELCDSMTGWGDIRLDTSSGEQLYGASQALKEAYEKKGKSHFARNLGWSLGGLALFVPMALMVPWLGSPVADFLGSDGELIAPFLFLLPCLFLWFAGLEVATIVLGRKRWSKQSAKVQAAAKLLIGVAGAGGMALLFTMDPALSAGFLAGTVIAGFFSAIMPSKTKRGARLAEQIDGLALYMGTAERHRLAILNPPEETPRLFESLLPYALALNVARTWADSFSSVLEEANYSPPWSAVDEHGGRLLFLHSFMHDFSRNIASSVSSYIPPTSSSYEGGSGFGGGSSGGGGGGGGGRGW